MGEFITCYENNRYSYRGYHDPEYENDPTYIKNASGEGDVCDHRDSTWGQTRDTCYFQVELGAETWTYKCMYHNECPLKDPVTGEGIMGCAEVTNKRITCCCNEDFCNGPNYVEYADLGYPENFVPSVTESKSNKPGTEEGYEVAEEYTEIATPENDETEIQVGDYLDNQADMQDEDTLLEQFEAASNDVNADQVTQESCTVTAKESVPCYAGGETSTKRYYNSTSDKCGDKQLQTGEYGDQGCDPSNPVYEVGKTYGCYVTDCQNGEFRFCEADEDCGKGEMINTFVAFVVVMASYAFAV